MTKEQAYQVQMAEEEKCEARGLRIIGRKIAYAAKATRELKGIGEPCMGYIPSDRLYLDGEEYDARGKNNYILEPEIVAVLKEDLKGPVITLTDVIGALEGLMPGFEVVDASPEPQSVEKEIQENMSFGAIVTGTKITPLSQIPDLALMGIVARKNGKLLSSAAAAEVMDGNPLKSVVWIGNKMLEQNRFLKKGDMILTGSPIKPFSVCQGDVCEAGFDHIGRVSVRIV